jgi:O-antigen ligase
VTQSTHVYATDDNGPTVGRWAARSLFLFPVLAALGPYASLNTSAGSSAYLYRVLCVVTIIPAFAALGTSRALVDSVGRTFVILTLLWLCWAPLPLLWSPERDADMKVLVSVSFALLGGFSVLSLSQGLAAGVDRLRVGWTWAFVATASIGLWEMLSGRHLENNPILRQTQPSYIASTFFNPNTYASFLLACLAPLASGMMAARSATSRRCYGALIAAWICLVAGTESRTGVLGAIAAAPLLAYWLVRVVHGKGRTTRLAVVFVGCVMLAALATLATPGLAQRMIGDFPSPFQEDANTALSDQRRVNLTLLGWRLFVDSGLLGRGPGAFERAAMTDSQGMDIGPLTRAHNSFIELAAEYGLLLLAPVLAIVAIAVFTALRGRRQDSLYPGVLNLRMSILLGAFAFLVGGMAGSSTLESPWWWVLLGHVGAQTWLLRRIRARVPHGDTSFLDGLSRKDLSAAAEAVRSCQRRT